MDPGQVARMQQAAESRMADRCTVGRRDGQRAYDKTTSTYTTAPGATVYAGPCLVKFGATQPREGDVVGQSTITQAIELHLPVGASGDVGPDMDVLVDESADPALVGRRFRVTGQFHQTYAASRRFPIEEVS